MKEYDIPADEKSTRNCLHCKVSRLTCWCSQGYHLDRALSEVMGFDGFFLECKYCKEFDNEWGL